MGRGCTQTSPLVASKVNMEILSGVVKGPSSDGPMNVCQAECVRNTKKETAKDASKPKQKVWTRLDNGLFAWRVKKKARKRLGTGADDKLISLPEQVSPSAQEKLRTDSTKSGLKGKLNFEKKIAGKESESFDEPGISVSREADQDMDFIFALIVQC